MTNLFVDAQEMHKKYPETFFVPTHGDLDTIKIGDYIKVCIKQERFWASVTEIDGNTIKAIVANELVNSPEHLLRYGNFIEVEKRHIYDILPPELI